jgi:hypothetical protein
MEELLVDVAKALAVGVIATAVPLSVIALLRQTYIDILRKKDNDHT